MNDMNEQIEMIRKICDSTKHKNPLRDILLECRRGQPEIVCLCGSTRFWKTFQEINLRETRAGKIVLSIGAATGSDAEHLATGAITNEDKQKLDELHRRKIDIANRVLVLNVGGYVGESTRGEINYARSIGVPVNYLVPVILNGKDRFA